MCVGERILIVCFALSEILFLTLSVSVKLFNPLAILEVGVKTVEVCVQLTFQNGSHKKHGSDMQRLCCNIIRNLNLVHIIRTYTEHYHYAQTKYTQNIDQMQPRTIRNSQS